MTVFHAKTSQLFVFIIAFFLCEIATVLNMIASDVNTTDQQQIKEEKEAQRAAEKIYRQALELFNEGSFWMCAKKLFILMDFYTEFYALDGVIYYMGECLYEEEMNDAALKMYKYLISNYPESKFIASTLYGLEKASYKAGDYKKTLTIYYRILKKENNGSVIDAARYFAGQSHFHLKNYDTAINIFKQISVKSEYYDSALYTTALAHLKKKAVATSIEHFKKLISLPITSGERRRIIDDARLTLGFIYYEINMYDESIELFSDISEKHEAHQDALLGMGWTFLKMGKYEEGIKPLLKLIERFPESANSEESYFLLGQAYIMIGEYDKSIAAYRTIVDLFPNDLQNASIMTKINTSLELEQEKVEKLKVYILIQESKLLTTLPLSGSSKSTPDYLNKEEKKLEEFRDGLIHRLVEERQNITFMRNQIDQLRRLSERKERRKDWRGYAEYGISRALFLKEMQYRAN